LGQPFVAEPHSARNCLRVVEYRRRIAVRIRNHRQIGNPESDVARGDVAGFGHRGCRRSDQLQHQGPTVSTTARGQFFGRYQPDPPADTGSASVIHADAAGRCWRRCDERLTDVGSVGGRSPAHRRFERDRWYRFIVFILGRRGYSRCALRQPETTEKYEEGDESHEEAMATDAWLRRYADLAGWKETSPLHGLSQDVLRQGSSENTLQVYKKHTFIGLLLEAYVE